MSFRTLSLSSCILFSCIFPCSSISQFIQPHLPLYQSLTASFTLTLIHLTRPSSLLFSTGQWTSFCCICVLEWQDKNSMKFDDFIQCCVMLKSLTDQFKRIDNRAKRGCWRIGEHTHACTHAHTHMHTHAHTHTHTHALARSTKLHRIIMWFCTWHALILCIHDVYCSLFLFCLHPL